MDIESWFRVSCYIAMVLAIAGVATPWRMKYKYSKAWFILDAALVVSALSALILYWAK